MILVTEQVTAVVLERKQAEELISKLQEELERYPEHGLPIEIRFTERIREPPYGVTKVEACIVLPSER